MDRNSNIDDSSYIAKLKKTLVITQTIRGVAPIAGVPRFSRILHLRKRSSHCFGVFSDTRSYAALRAADLDWIIGPGYSSGGYILGENHEKPTWNHENRPGPMENQPGTMKNHEN